MRSFSKAALLLIVVAVALPHSGSAQEPQGLPKLSADALRVRQLLKELEPETEIRARSRAIGMSPSITCGKKIVTIPLIIEGPEHGFFEGNLGSNTLISPGIANMDITFTKNTRLPFLGEAGSLQFRTEFYNILNRPNFGDPSMTIFRRPRRGRPTERRLYSTAARIDDTRTTSRQLQFGLKVIF